MKHIVLVACLFLSLFTIAQSNQKSLLWKIEGKGLQQPSYLFGTIHFICPTQLQVDSAIVQGLRSTKQLYLELDMDDPNMMAEMQRYMMMKDTAGWKQYLTAQQYQIVSDSLKAKTGMNGTMLNRFKPFMVMSMVMPKLLPCAAPASWEATLMGLAKKNKQEVKGLETIARQMQAIDAMSDKETAEQLYSLVTNLDSSSKAFTQLMNVYLAKDVEGMQAITQQQSNSAFEKELLVKRNEEWIPLIENIAKENATFFAVGAAHLGGQKGVLALLKAKGYKVTPVVY